MPLPTSISAFNLLLATPKASSFENNCVEVTRRIANLMAKVFRGIISRGEPRDRVLGFILRK